MAKTVDTQTKKQGDNKRKRESTASGTDGGQVAMVNGEDQAKKNKRSNKQRVLMLSSRGSTERIRHVMADLEALLPHSKKESKMSASTSLTTLNELADLNNCNNILFFQCKHHLNVTDTYLWLAKAPNGPSVKFQLQNLHTMDELKLSGNCLKGSRPILSFSNEFDQVPQWQLLRELFTQAFGVPQGSRRSKPFFDHMLTFSIVDNKVWVRNYQIIETDPVAIETKATSKPLKKGSANAQSSSSLIEIGPRFVLDPIRIFEGSFGGPTVFENEGYTAPTLTRRIQREEDGQKYQQRRIAKEKRHEKEAELKMPEDALGTRAVFA